MSATKVRGRARHETVVSASLNITRLYRTSRHAQAEVHVKFRAIRCAAARDLRGSSRTQASLDPAVLNDAAGDFLDGAFGRIEARDRIAPKQRIGRAQLVLDLLSRGIAAFGTALVADLLQALGLD